MNSETEKSQHFGELGGPVTKLGVADLLFAVAVVALAAGWIALAALL